MEMEKIYTSECPTSAFGNGAMLGAMMNRDNGAELAMLNNGMNNWANNPFIYLVWMMFAQRMWGNENGVNNTQLQAIQSQMSDNQNANLIMDGIKGVSGAISQLANNLNCDFNTLNNAICDVRSGIQKVAGQVGFSAERIINAVNMGDCNIITAIKDCCCTTQQSILKMGYENQLANYNQTNTLMNGIAGVNNALHQGFSATAYANQQQTCDLINNQNANTQRIIDTLNCHWNQDLQQRYNDARLELSQLRQNAVLIDALKPATTTAA